MTELEKYYNKFNEESVWAEGMAMWSLSLQ